MTTDKTKALKRLEPLLKLKGEKIVEANVWDAVGGVHIALITRAGSLSEGTLRYLKIVVPYESVLSSLVSWVPDDHVKRDPQLEPGPSISQLFGENSPGDLSVHVEADLSKVPMDVLAHYVDPEKLVELMIRARELYDDKHLPFDKVHKEIAEKFTDYMKPLTDEYREYVSEGGELSFRHWLERHIELGEEKIKEIGPYPLGGSPEEIREWVKRYMRQFEGYYKITEDEKSETTEEPNPYMASEDDLTDYLELDDRDRARVLFRAIANVNQTIEGMGNQIGPPTTRNLDQRLNELREIVHELMRVKAPKATTDSIEEAVNILREGLEALEGRVDGKAPMGNVAMLEKVVNEIKEIVDHHTNYIDTAENDILEIQRRLEKLEE